MFKIAVCDDNPQHMEEILTLLEKYKANRPGAEPQPQSFISGDAVLTAIDNGSAFDLFLFDILMPGLNGIDLARKVRERDNDVPIVFLTSSADYSLDAFCVYALQYILKPVTEDGLFPVLDKISALLKCEEGRFFLLAMPKRVVKIPFMSIVCVELANRALRVYHEDGSILLSKSIRSPFEASVSALLADGRFLCPHKSFLINMEHVDELNGCSFVMKHGLEVPIPRYRYAEVKTKYFDWLSERGVGRMGGK